MIKAALNVYVCTDHAAHYVGGASVIIAADENEARRLLVAELKEHGLNQGGGDAFSLRLICTTSPRAYVLSNGDY